MRVLAVPCVLAACGGAAVEGPDGAEGGAASLGGASHDGGQPATGGYAHGGALGGAVNTVGGATPATGGISFGGATQGGSPVVQGGAPTKGGTTSFGGKSSGLGGWVESGAGGAAGAEAGSAGAPSAGASGAGGGGSCEDYLACGCVCCGTAPTVATACYYPEIPGDVQAIIAADEAEKEAKCATPGSCTQGGWYTCCTSLPTDTSPTGSYSATYYSGGLDHLYLNKIEDPMCTRIALVRPVATSRLRTVLALPQGWGWDVGSYMSCAMSAEPNNAIGALGSIELRWDGAVCLLDVHMTAFFQRGGAVSAVRFDADGLSLNGFSEPSCH